MSEQIISILKKELDELVSYGELSADVRQNKVKEILQYYVLDFIYHHPEYSKWVMYGGSALRIIHGLDRMSVDLDFEVVHDVDKEFLKKLRVEIEKHFTNTYGTTADFLILKTISTRSLLLKFNVGDALKLGRGPKQVHVKIDLNHFVAPKTVTESRLINHNQLSFVILTYNKGALMASKIAAIFLREKRGRGKNVYDYKGRDIYDLLWYMKEKATPDFDYLNAKLKEKSKEIPDIRALFDKLTIDILNYEKMDNCLKDDLSFLFENPFQFNNWLKTWRENYLRLLDKYKIRTITTLQEIIVSEDFHTDTFSFAYLYKTIEEVVVCVTYAVVYEWIVVEKVLGIQVDDAILELTRFEARKEPSEQLRQFVTLFAEKTKDYFQKTNKIMLGDNVGTKVIRSTASNLNQKEQIVLNKSALLSCELDDLLR